MAQIQFISIIPEQLQSEITAGVKLKLDDYLKHFKPIQPKEYLSRQDDAKMFGVDISTVHNCCKTKKLNPFGIGSRVYFLHSEVGSSLQPLNQ